MGLIYHDARQLLRARAAGCTFGATVTIGRQAFFLRPRQAEALAREFDAGGEWTRIVFGQPADKFFTEALGALSIEAIDVSNYEDASIIHDMNQPISPDREQQFDAVIDGGSLEHIFNVPVALANLMRLAKVGGTVFISTPSNNLSGHGFYQFSPELVHRVFTADYGFEKQEVSIAEYSSPHVETAPPIATWSVADPERVGSRVLLMSPRSAMLWVQARKTQHLNDPFSRTPQQSDYVIQWEQTAAVRQTTSRGPLKTTLGRLAPAWVRSRRHRRYLKRLHSTQNASAYERLE